MNRLPYPLSSPFVRGWITRVALPVWFLAIDVRWFDPRWIGIDARIYVHAASAWLSGLDPWAASASVPVYGTFTFAAPPPTLLPYAAIAWLPETLAVASAQAVVIAAAIWTVRRLRLPWWWLAFPPVLDSIWSANPDVCVLALLIALNPVADTLAAAIKVYAAIPLILSGRWRSLLLVGVFGIVTWFVLPWGLYIREYPSIAHTLDLQGKGLSAWGAPILMLLCTAALMLLGARRASWLAVPALWPFTQLHYSVLALPALSPLLAAGFALPIPGAIPIVLTVEALWVKRDAMGRLAGSVRRRSGLASTAHRLAERRREIRASNTVDRSGDG